MDDLLLYTHLGLLAVVLWGIVRADHAAFLWLRGRTETVSLTAARNTHVVVTLALSGLVLTGLFLFWPMREYLLGQPLFLLKMAFVAVLIINSFFIELLMPTASTKPFATLTEREKLPLMLSGAVSTLSWLGAALAAILFFGWPF